MGLTLVQVPYDSGQRGRRMGAGPLHLLDAGLAARLAELGHDVQVQAIETCGSFPTESGSAFELAGGIRDAVVRARENHRFPIVMAGNCISAVGTVAGLGRPSVVWFDAHGDLNTPATTASGFLDGMAVSVLLGRCWQQMAMNLGLEPVDEASVWMIGVRDLDSAEEEFLARSAVHRITADAAGRRMLPQPTGEVYVHVDLDVLDPDVIGRVNQFASPGGLTLETLLETIDAIAGCARIGAVALTAYDPVYDEDGAVASAATTLVEHIAGLMRT